MGDSTYYQPWQFNFEGIFSGLVGDADGKRKYIRLDFSDRNLEIKLTKDLRQFASFNLRIGERVIVSGTGKLDPETGDLKFKAVQITPVENCPPGLPDRSTDRVPELATLSAAIPSDRPTKIRKILICQKSDCLKHGGRKLYQAVENALRDRGLLDQIAIERTGCLKRCSSGSPNVAFMPGKKYFSVTNLDELPTLLEKHL